MLNLKAAIAIFKATNPTVLDKALLVKRTDSRKQVFVWSNEDPVSTINKWKKIHGSDYSVRVVSEPNITWNKIWKSATPVTAGLRQCRLR